MRVIIAILYLVGCAFSASGNLSDTSKALKVGQVMPDILLGDMIFNPGKESPFLKGKTKWSELMGKVIILDFWMTTCGSCIEGFPKMSKLKEQFEDQVEIILVNPYESKEKIEEWIKVQNRDGRKVLPDNLTMLFSKELDQYFPTTYSTGFHVWLDKDRVVRLRGISENTNATKIRQLINGDTISFIRDSPPLLDLIRHSLVKLPHGSIGFNSYFEEFNSEYGGPYAYGKRNVVDSNSKTIRTTFINLEAEEFIKEAYKSEFANNKIILMGDFYILEKPKLLSQNPKYYNDNIDDSIFSRTRLCYEQILPMHIPDSLREKFMRDDLNKYFYQMFGVEAFYATRMRNCFKLIKLNEVVSTSARVKRKAHSKGASNGKGKLEYKNLTVHEIFGSYFQSVPSDLFGQEEPLIIDDTGFNGKITMFLPDYTKVLNNLEDLRTELKNVGFDLIYGESAIRTLVVGQREHVANW
ncbi:TlpA family protein disulfide reductase [Pedobacter africanus]|uniref:TlpA family protein disulfide reductase n=1 Tax=Pedobacter africanus TaxID=151894 RepID=UPI003399C36F